MNRTTPAALVLVALGVVVPPASAEAASDVQIAEQFCRSAETTAASINPEVLNVSTSESPSHHVRGHLVAATVDRPDGSRWLCVVGVLAVDATPLTTYSGAAQFNLTVGSAPPGMGSANYLPPGTRMLVRLLTNAVSSSYSTNFSITGSETRSELRQQKSTVTVDRTPAERRAAKKEYRASVARALRTYAASRHTRADRNRRDKAISKSIAKYKRAVAPVKQHVTTLVPVPVETLTIDLSGSMEGP